MISDVPLGLYSKKASGPDNISAHMISRPANISAHLITTLIACLFTLIFKNGKFQLATKSVFAIPIYICSLLQNCKKKFRHSKNSATPTDDRYK